MTWMEEVCCFFFFEAEDGIRYRLVTGVQTCALPIYKKLFMLEGIELEFRESALKAIVQLAMELKAGARALRSVMEEHLLDIMYYIPEMEGVERVIITKDTIMKGKEPLYKQSRKRKSA